MDRTGVIQMKEIKIFSEIDLIFRLYMREYIEHFQ